MAVTEIKLGGFGGQGVILAGIIIGKAASIFDNKHATLTQSFGPEARGSSCSAQLVVADDTILYPYVQHPDIMVLMSQDAYRRFSHEIKPGGILIIEEDLVEVGEVPVGAKIFRIPATKLAEELGRKMVLNIVMVGFFVAVTKLIDDEAMKKAVEDSVPPGTAEINIKAYERGYAYGLASQISAA